MKVLLQKILNKKSHSDKTKKVVQHGQPFFMNLF